MKSKSVRYPIGVGAPALTKALFNMQSGSVKAILTGDVKYYERQQKKHAPLTDAHSTWRRARLVKIAEHGPQSPPNVFQRLATRFLRWLLSKVS